MRAAMSRQHLGSETKPNGHLRTRVIRSADEVADERRLMQRVRRRTRWQRLRGRIARWLSR